MGGSDFRRVLVTGASGYLGQLVVAQAVASGWSVRAVDIARPPRASTNAKIDYCITDLTSQRDYVEVVAGVDAVVHLAALSSDAACKSHALMTNRLNVDVPRRLAVAARDAGA